MIVSQAGAPPPAPQAEPVTESTPVLLAWTHLVPAEVREAEVIIPVFDTENFEVPPTCRSSRFFVPEPVAVSVIFSNNAVYPAVLLWFTVGVREIKF